MSAVHLGNLRELFPRTLALQLRVGEQKLNQRPEELVREFAFAFFRSVAFGIRVGAEVGG